MTKLVSLIRAGEGKRSELLDEWNKVKERIEGGEVTAFAAAMTLRDGRTAQVWCHPAGTARRTCLPRQRRTCCGAYPIGR